MLLLTPYALQPTPFLHIMKTAKLKKKSGIVTLIGRTNVGKSTLLNTLVGTKIAAVTHKPQTTRVNLHGVLNRPQGQAVFIDTPGVFKYKKNWLGDTIEENVEDALREIDAVVYVVDPTTGIGAEERSILARLRKLEGPKIMVINKSDLSPKQKPYLEDYLALKDEFIEVIQISALRARHIEPLIEKLFAVLPNGEPLYPPEQVTNVDKETWVAEIIREKVFLALRKEVPYAVNVEVDDIEDKEKIFLIKARVLTAEKRYKEMIIGARGRAIKEIGIAARKELEQALGKKIFLELEVEADRHWMERI
jgi:GTPase